MTLVSFSQSNNRTRDATESDLNCTESSSHTTGIVTNIVYTFPSCKLCEDLIFANYLCLHTLTIETLRGEKLNYKSGALCVSKGISKPPFWGVPEVQ